MKLLISGIVFLFLSMPVIVSAEGALPVYTIVIKEHHFTPDVLKVKAGEKFKLIIDNQDDTPEEFESSELKREKLIKAHKKGSVLLGPLSKGSYAYVGEFNEATAKGSIVVE